MSNARTAASSVAVLTQAFDFDLHLENEKPISPKLYSRSINFLGIAVILVLVSTLLHLHPLQLSAQRTQSSINSAITSQINERLEQTKDLNEQLSTRMNTLNDTISSLRSRVFEVEKKPVVNNIDVFVAAKSKIDESLKSLKARIEAQSKKWDETSKIQQRTAAELERSKVARSLEISTTNAVIRNIEGNFTLLRSKIEAVTNSQTAMTETRLIAHEQLLLEVAKLEERFQSALENAGGVFSYMKGDLGFVFNDETSTWDRVASSSYSDAFVESIVRDVWIENEEAYQSTLPNRVCPVVPVAEKTKRTTKTAKGKAKATSTTTSIKKLKPKPKTDINGEEKTVSTIVPATSKSNKVEAVQVENIEKSIPATVTAAVVMLPDFARRVAGAKVVLEGTSATYIHPSKNLKLYSSTLLNYFGIREDNFIRNNGIANQLSQFTDSVTPYLTNVLGLNNGIGSPDDVISPDMSLGSCWPMEVRGSTYNDMADMRYFVFFLSLQ
jgi:hypothetical protein